MPTTKRRINITVDDKTYAALARLSKRRKRSVSHIGVSLIEQALDYAEDLHFSRESDDRLKRRERRLPHQKVWD